MKAIWKSGFLVGLFVIVASLLRLYPLGREPLWIDEAYGVMAAVIPLREVLERIPNSGNAPLFYVIMHLWTSLFGDSEFAVRLPSALAGIAVIPLLYWMGRRMLSRRAGLVAAGLAAVSPLHLHYSVEARMYPLVVLLSLGVVAVYSVRRGLYSVRRGLLKRFSGVGPDVRISVSWGCPGGKV